MKAVIIDASVAVKWAVTEDYSAQALSLLVRCDELHAPAHWLAEAANALWAKYLVHHTLTHEGLVNGIDMFVRAPVVPVPLAQLARAATLLSVDLRLVVYDSLYIALAVGRALPFVTADRRLFDKMCARPMLQDLARWIGSADRDE